MPELGVEDAVRGLCLASRDAPVQAAFWVGVDRQGLMMMDRRFSIPAYLGPGGWIALDVAAGFDVGALRGLALESYRHFALARMLKALPDAVTGGHAAQAVSAGRSSAPRLRQAARKRPRPVR